MQALKFPVWSIFTFIVSISEVECNSLAQLLVFGVPVIV